MKSQRYSPHWPHRIYEWVERLAVSRLVLEPGDAAQSALCGDIAFGTVVYAGAVGQVV